MSLPCTERRFYSPKSALSAAMTTGEEVAVSRSRARSEGLKEPTGVDGEVDEEDGEDRERDSDDLARSSIRICEPGTDASGPAE